FNSGVPLSCSGLPAGAPCGFSANPVTPPANGSANSTLTVTVAGTTATGTTNFQVVGTSGATTHNAGLSLTVTLPGPVTVFFDNFETDKGWTRNPSGTDTATTGLWERGTPQATSSGGTQQVGTPTSGTNDLVTGATAGATVGVNDIDGGTTSTQSPASTPPAPATTTLNFQSYFAHLNNSSTADFFRVQIVGSTTTTVFQVLGSAAQVNGAFAPHSADISAFNGQTIRILISAADAATGSLV